MKILFRRRIFMRILLGGSCYEGSCYEICLSWRILL